MGTETREWFVADADQIETRDEPGQSLPKLIGYAAVYNRKSVDLGGFVEVIEPGAFDEAIAESPDVAARVQHQPGLGTIGRTRNGTLKLTGNAKGLKYEVQPPDTQAGRDIVQLIRRGDISGSSFAFTLRGERATAERWDWSTTPATRHLLRVNLHDIAPVDGPAYLDTSVSVRSFNEAREAQTEKPVDGEPRRIDIYDTIGPDWLGMVGAKTIRRAMEGLAAEAPIDVHLNTPGGSVWEGTTIYNIFAEHKGDVRVFIDGIAASMGSLIAMAGDEIHMASNGYMMIHEPWTVAIGAADELRKTAQQVDESADNLAKTYATRTGKEAGAIRAMMREETWFNSGEAALAAGFATHVTPAKAAAIKIDEEVAKRFRRMPQELRVACGLETRDESVKPIRRVVDLDKWLRENRRSARGGASS